MDESIPATMNYWGSEDGPDPDKIIGDVDYEPWLEGEPDELPWGLGKGTGVSNPNPDLLLYRDGLRQMRNGEYVRAGRRFQRLLSQYQNSYFAKFALNRWIQTRFRLNLSNDILPYLNGLDNSNIPDLLKTHILKTLVHVYRKQGNSSNALHIINSHINDADLDNFMKFQKGFLLLHDLQDTVNAVIAFESFINDYPEDIRTPIVEFELSSLEGNYLPKRGKSEYDRNIPDEFRLYTVYPNPFNVSTIISYDLAEDSRVTISIYNILGEEIKLLKSEYQAVGHYSIYWDGTNNFGYSLCSGVYLIHMEAGKFSSIMRCLLLK